MCYLKRDHQKLYINGKVVKFHIGQQLAILILTAWFLKFCGNKWVISNWISVFSQRFSGSPRGKHCNSPERKCMRKVVSTSKITILEWNCRFFRRLFFFIRNGFGYCRYKGSVSFCSNNHEIIVNLLIDFSPCARLLGNRHRTVSKFRNISYKSPINNSIKPVQFFWRLSLLLAFFLAC